MKFFGRSRVGVVISSNSGAVSTSSEASNFILAARKTDIINYAREGGDLIVEFVDGSKLILKDFFANGNDFHNLVLSDGLQLTFVDLSRALSQNGDGISEAAIVYSKVEEGGKEAEKVLLGLLGIAAAGVVVAVVSSSDDDLEISPVPTPPVFSAPVAVSKISGIDPDTGVSDSDFITSSAAIVIKGEVSGVLGAGEVVQVRIDEGA